MDAPHAEHPTPPCGRPKTGRIATKVTFVASRDYKAWLGSLAASLGVAEVSDVCRAGVRLLAENAGHAPPPAPR